jgi:hypothetical protein
LAMPHLEALGIPYHSCTEGMFCQAHALGLGQSPHGPVEVGRASKVEQGTSKLTVGHNNDVQSSVLPSWSWELAHTQVLLLLAIILLAHQIICEKPWQKTGDSWEGKQSGSGLPVLSHLLVPCILFSHFYTERPCSLWAHLICEIPSLPWDKTFSLWVLLGTCVTSSRRPLLWLPTVNLPSQRWSIYLAAGGC